MKALIGLGNPGKEYEGTRHNAGFEVVDNLNNRQSDLSIKEEFSLNKRLFAQLVFSKLFTKSVSGQPDRERILLAKPVTYMNDSGKAVLAIKDFYKLDLKDLLIIHDDISLPLGKIRLQKQGGAGGQHGVESIIECLGGEKNFNRLKIGIGPDPGGDVRIRHVLQRFTNDEKVILNKVLELAVQASLSWLIAGIDQAMNSFNGLDPQTLC